MLKYYNYMVTFSEVPDEITLCINISNCPIRCPDCHSKFLWDDIGTPLTNETISNIIKNNKDVTCICLMGGDSSLKEIKRILSFIRCNYPQYKLCWYSGRNVSIFTKDKLFQEILNLLDYIKLGPYIKKYGGLDSPTTNQVFYKIERNKYVEKGKLITDITNRFYENKNIYKEDRQDSNSSSNN